MHETKGLTAKVDIPSRWLPGDYVEITASNGYIYEVQVPAGSEPGQAVLYAEASVPMGAEPGDEIMVVVTDPMFTQLDLGEQLEVAVPEGYEANDIIIILLDVSVESVAVADIDWDASWKSFRAPLEKSVEQLPRPSSSILEKAATSRHRERQDMEPCPSGTGPSGQRVRCALRHALSDTVWVAISILAALLACAPTKSWS